MMHGQMDACARLCHECQDECLKMIRHCLELGGEHAAVSHQTLLADCAHVCHTCEAMMHRGSGHSAGLCRACAAVCRACAESCQSLAIGPDGDRHRRFATICRRCAESCELMAAA